MRPPALRSAAEPSEARLWLPEDPDCLGKGGFTALAQDRISATERGLHSAMHSGSTEMKDLVRIKEGVQEKRI